MFVFLFFVYFLTKTYASEEVIDAKEFLQGLERRLNGTGDFLTNLPNKVCSENVIDVYYLDLKKHNLSQLISTFGDSKNASLIDFTDASSFVYDVFLSQDFIKRIKVDDSNHMLMRDGNFLPQEEECTEIDDVIIRKAQGGTRAVGIYEWETRKRICLKQWPEVPTAEIAAYHLFKGIYSKVCSEDDMPLPMSEVILMNKQIFSVSRFMEGRRFDEFLKAKTRRQRNVFNNIFDSLSLQKFQRLAIFCLLTMPEDCRPQNCFIRKIRGTEEYEFVLIDNERSFGKEMVEGTRSHCILFCCREKLDKGIEKEVYEDLTTTKDELIESGARLVLEMSYHAKLLEMVPELEREIIDRQIVWGMPINLDSICKMVSKIKKLTTRIKENNKITLLNLFQELLPNLASYYFNASIPLQMWSTTELEAVNTRIRNIDGRRFSGPTPLSADSEILKEYFGKEIKVIPAASSGVF